MVYVLSYITVFTSVIYHIFPSVYTAILGMACQASVQVLFGDNMFHPLNWVIIRSV
jgi:hypothetical protein